MSRKLTPLMLAVLCLALAIYQLALTFYSGEWRNPSEEMVSKWENRIQPVREALPLDVKQIGYVDDAIIIGDSAPFDIHEFQFMQYSLAPIPVQMGIENEWTVGNFNDDETLEIWLDRHHGAYDVQGFGFGLYLIHDLEN